MAASILPACARCGKPCKFYRSKFCSIQCKGQAESIVLQRIESSGLSVDEWLARHYYATGCNLATASVVLELDKRTLWAFLKRWNFDTRPQSESQSGSLNPFHGKRHSDETKFVIGTSSQDRQYRMTRNETKQYGDGPAQRYEASPLFKNGARAYRRRAMETMGSVCIKCGAVDDIEVHHKDRNRKNNALSNLAVLCRKCHRAEHRRESMH